LETNHSIQSIKKIKNVPTSVIFLKYILLTRSKHLLLFIISCLKLSLHAFWLWEYWTLSF